MSAPGLFSTQRLFYREFTLYAHPAWLRVRAVENADLGLTSFVHRSVRANARRCRWPRNLPRSGSPLMISPRGRIARELHLGVTGPSACCAAKRRGLIPLLRPALDCLLEELFFLTPQLYELKDGAPNLISFQVERGLYIIPKVLERGYLAIGKQRLVFETAR
jgi:hypothetical protein